MKYLGITNKEIIKRYKIWNAERLDDDTKGTDIVKRDNVFKIYANKHFRGSHAGHYLAIENIVEIKEKIDEDNPNYWQKTLIAHEFAHSLISHKKIIGNRRGHGVLYYVCLLRDVIWYASNLSLSEKMRTIEDEFSYSCSLGQYRGTNRIFRSQSCKISLDLSYFTINDLFHDARSDINNLGQWLWDQISEYVANFDNKSELLDLPISDLIDMASKKFGKENIEITDEQQIKILRR
jgi:predicted SprT family Zn-dependent metalloprotease